MGHRRKPVSVEDIPSRSAYRRSEVDCPRTRTRKALRMSRPVHD
ncbi:hypothetical protein B005_2993 [Nocardiopsis alba ATCC BAA-2165]|uniref:Uncharacterized protein n=1 Tax=Nocardiopsis alba (strain ATCC BAA-2165 / BE74) TaxID=1205910 RepID=J7L2M7_NOCAA|nr:hypothetical protein B005_2993 [Nocardiopsis alba ATCC BAA-2165]